MISKDLLKEIILANREFILKEVGGIIRREAVDLPGRTDKVSVLYGVRRSGKTFILYDLFKKFADSALYIDFEDERLIDFKLSDFELLKEAFLELNPSLLDKRKIFLLDEIQNISGWEKFCRRATEREKISIFVTGSSSKIMPLQIHTSLRGRAWSIEITPFSFKEYLKAKGASLTKELVYGPKKIFIKAHFKDYLKWGGFPEIVFSKSDFERTKILKEYLGSIFFKDIVERFKISNIPLLELLIEGLFSSFSKKVSLTAFYKQYKDKLPFSKDTLFGYYKHLLESMTIYGVKKFSESAYKRIRNPAKVYLADIGLAKRVLSQDLGRLLENVVFIELNRHKDKIFYFEEKKECDFVAVNDSKLFVCQVCYELNEENREREFEGLISCNKLMRRKEGFILTFDQEEELVSAGVKIKVMPVWKWLLLK